MTSPMSLHRPVRTTVRLLVVVLAAAVLATSYSSHRSPASVVRQWAVQVGVLHTTVGSPSSYAFESTYGPSAQPTRWAACSTISYRVNLANAPHNALTVLATQLARTRAVTGLDFVYAGSSAATAAELNVYDASGALAPVVFAWEPSGQLLGATNVNAVTVPIVDATHAHYTSAVVLFNADMNAAFVADPTFAANLVLHEVGHVLGLADVNDAAQVMNTTLAPNTTVGAYGVGDLAGLGRLYSANC